MTLYTAHRRAGGGADEDMVLIVEGFCWPAFLLTVFWALWHRLWLTAAVILGLGLGLDAGALGAGEASRAVLSLAIMALVGFSANDLRRRALRRRGNRSLGPVSGASREAAERRVFDRPAHASFVPAAAAP
jgi:hypothetical protein